MSSLTNPATIVESDRTFKLRMEYERSRDLDYLEQTYPVTLDPTGDANGDPIQYYAEPTEPPPSLSGPMLDVELIDLPDAPDFQATQDPGYWSALARDGIGRLPVIAGGSPESVETTEAELAREWDLHGVFEPSAEDREEYARWSAELDGIAFPAKAPEEGSVADRQRWARQNVLSEESFANTVE